ncbi:ribosomal protein S18-alanine N-acetyltransferase [Nocardia cyriacigeorgica]|uniref:ribosomal protein S18-alanine N-acetyltransferase n=1 Tax=Nocardia cyriacigeorgica TaxID=135487 RepID=UPI0002DA6FDD|nr:ribosomal protein S18-alanine N-acetyltransferase [Nocardia cyriacigeorgica]MBF6087017.1 ribosomal protein S18-alanine N-acetyltransferase [Nocardia cyriacigeorgica]MBF6093046.1 ribosomal protein S18-alanine N-acetyltransferase [Nocardia cyriacigeorgica]MBF6397642.1 ribosomal protein S18-alanine N-acetyltransferase [Nocardia cyriacigeorgica]MBF6402700.1 ribosomal protein S18-alanine N-acetyltransferase [Nocardia cyriacigeorgica]MBF6498162.1 ribosomal protein S18-alanine N-acetyltransferase 
MGIRIEPMTVADIDRCVELEQLLFPEDDPWHAVSFRSELAAGHNRYITARDEDGQMVGYAGIALLGDNEHPEAEVHTIGVDPQCHRAGIGTKLLEALLAEAGARGGPVFLEVRTDNAAAIALYAKHGFHIIGLRKNYYHPSGADAYTMRRPALSSAGAQWGEANRPDEVLS